MKKLFNFGLYFNDIPFIPKSLMYFHCIWCVFLLIERAESDEVNEMIKKCVDRQLETKFELPLEIVNDKGELELWIRYNGKYDLYQTYNNGHIYHQEWQLSEKITPRTGPNRANCSKFVLLLSYHKIMRVSINFFSVIFHLRRTGTAALILLVKMSLK